MKATKRMPNYKGKVLSLFLLTGLLAIFFLFFSNAKAYHLRRLEFTESEKEDLEKTCKGSSSQIKVALAQQEFDYEIKESGSEKLVDLIEDFETKKLKDHLNILTGPIVMILLILIDVGFWISFCVLCCKNKCCVCCCCSIEKKGNCCDRFAIIFGLLFFLGSIVITAIIFKFSR